MKTKFYTTALLAFIIQVMVNGQTLDNQISIYNDSYWQSYTQKLNLNEAEKIEFLSSKKHAHNALGNQNTSQKPVVPNGNNNIMAGCNNMDFETGNTQGWTLSSGFHPIWNQAGCCLTQGGQQVVVGGNALDPICGFPVTAPGGNFSLRLGNNATGGEADRVEQTFMVSAANANFTYRYAVVFQDPGHVAAQQPAFVIEMFDSLNNAIPCTYYNVSSGQNIPGFLNAQNGVVYKPWTNVVVDLTNYIGQNVTIRFTSYDCALGGHFGYAYIDGNCAAFIKGNNDTICVGGTKNICAPNGFGSYTWNGPNVNNLTNQCVNVASAGVYTCATTLVTNCQGPTFTYTIHNYPVPAVSFVQQTNSACDLANTMVNTSSISLGSIVSYTWNLGNNTTSNQTNPAVTYPAPGNYPVSLSATSDKGCINTNTATITIHPNPNPGFLFNNICQYSSVNFTNTSTIAQGNIVNYVWNFSNNQSSTLMHPNIVFSTSGPVTVSLTATSNHNCVVTISNTINVNPQPVVGFNNNNVCLGNVTNFQNTSTINTGNITNYIWNFNGYNTATNVNANYTFPNYGTYTVQLTAVSNNNCLAFITKTVVVHPNPVISFNVPNTCANSPIQISNTSFVANGAIASYTWNFSNNTSANVPVPFTLIPAPGTYSVNLAGTTHHNCTAFASNTFVIYALPQVNFTSNNACLNQMTQFNNSTIISNGNISKWLWDFNNDGTWDDTTSVHANHMYAYAGAFNCKLMAVSNNNCVGYATNPVIVHANPKADFTANSTCLGDRTDFTNLSGSAYSPITSYQWQYYGDGNISNVYPNASHTYSYTGTYLVKLEVQNQFGCTHTLSKKVNVNPKPVAGFVANKVKGCESLCVTFTNQSSISSGSIVTNQWQFGDGSLPNYNINPQHCYNNGKYTVTLKLVSDSGCISTYVNHAMIEVYPKAIASFVTEPEELDELEPLLSVWSNAKNADDVTYYINDGSIFLKDNFSHTFTNLDKQKPIIFQVANNKYGCADTTSKIINLKQSYAIYIPNTFTPNYDGLNDGFKASGYNITKFNLKIFDRWGKLIFETNDMNTAWDGRTKDSVDPIKDDVYVWKANVVDINNKTHDLVGHVTLLK